MGGGVEKTKYHYNGFTLAELLAVIAILGVIALIAFPAVNKVIKNSKEKAYTAQKEIILSSAKNWGLDNLSSLSEEEDTYLSIDELKQGGYLEAKQVVNPKTDEEMTGCVVIYYDSEYNQYVYEYNEAGCSEVSSIPVITLNGDKNITIDLGETYTELGATAKYKEQDISSSIEISGTVDTNIQGTYTIRYNVTYDGKKAKEVTRTVKVLAQEEPVSIILNPDHTEGYVKSVTVSVITTGNIKTLTYKVNGGEEKTVVDNKITLDQDGKYTLEVIATDNKGEITTVTSGTYSILNSKPAFILTVPEGTFNENGWAKNDFNVSINTTNINIKEYKYCYGNDCTPTDTVLDITTPIPVTTEGDSNYVCVVLVDIANNESNKVCEQYKLDKTISEPTITAGSSANSNGWYKNNISMNITTGTDLSTIKEIKYCTTTDTTCTPSTTVNGASTTVTISTESATNYICALSIDKAGNESTTKCSGPYKLDKTNPELTVPADVSILPSQVASYNLLTGASATDSLSGVDGSITTSGSLSAVEKTYTITYTVKDKAGNSISKNRNITVKASLASDIIKESSDVMTNDPDRNLRYVGSNPNNYVRFNNELWRIIGVFNGQVKIIKETPYDASIAWDKNSDSGGHGYYGWNDWNQATLKTELNTTFLNSMDATSKTYIDTNHIWNLGGASGTEYTRSNMYNKERGTEVYSGRPTTWTGAIGLMYPSDYGYATSSTDNTCDTTSMYDWDSGTAQTECASKLWLYSSSRQWVLTHYSDSVSYVFHVGTRGFAYNLYAYNSYSATPVLYLKENVLINGGTGTSSNPYTLTLDTNNLIEKVYESKETARLDPDGNLRYVGTNPSNYVTFNNEKWRIIGVFNGQVKIIRETPYNTSIKWDTNNENDWNQATLKTELNTTFLNSVDATSKSYIDTTHTWTLGGAPSDSSEWTREKMYNYERGTEVYSGRPTTWTGAIALMYPSDYGYATSSTDNTCNTTTMYSWDSGTAKTECVSKSWLYNSSKIQWILTPNSDRQSYVFIVSSYGHVSTNYAYNVNSASPVLYLKSDVKVKSGNGTSSSPYVLGI